MNKTVLTALVAVFIGAVTLAQAKAPTPPTTPTDGSVALSALDVSRAAQTWGNPRKDLSVGRTPLRIAGREFKSGFGTHSFSRLFVHLSGRATRFSAQVGLNEITNGSGSVEFKVIGDGKALWSSGVMRTADAAKPVSVDVSGVQYLTLEVTDGGDGLGNDHADWADARFEGVSGPIQVVERLPEQQGKIVSGAPWRDTAGNLIQAHGGGILRYGDRYYWYGEDRSNGYVAIGVSAYVSDDLVNWKHLGVVLPASAYNEKWKERNIAERPKVVYNPHTKKFVLWFHYDRSGYADSQAGVAVADRPEGPFRFLGMHRPIEKSTYRDMNLFVDEDGKGGSVAYAIYAGEENYTMHIVRLNADWTEPEQPMVEGKTWIRTLIRGHREAPAPFKYGRKYYLITSAATGWNPNPAAYAFADSMLGEWKPMPNPFVGAGREITFGSQSTFVLPVPGRPNSFIYLGDRWNPQDLADARYIWLPFQMKEDGTFEVRWQDQWEPKELGFPAPKAVPAAATERPLHYRLADGADQWPVDKRRQVMEAMDAAVALYNQTGDFPKEVIASYNPGTPTADGNYNGRIRFGGQIGRRTALHELGHVLGVGTHPKWRSLIVDGKWTGPNALAQLRAFDGPDAVLHADRQHFWPYGLNFDRESSPENDRRHVLMVAAFRRDLGIVTGEPIRGMVGVGTWETQAEFKDIRVTSGDVTLYAADFKQGLQGWKTARGHWETAGGALLQTGAEEGVRAIVGSPEWGDYTLTLKARKRSGKEGFLILFGLPGDDTKSWWNLGGWGNTQHGLELPGATLTQVPGSIETGRWYDIRIEVRSATVRCYLDGNLIQQATR